jgi:DnaJ-class molecular chaperone
MSSCDGCYQLFDGLSDYCPECEREMKDWIKDDTCPKCKGSGEVEWDDDICSIPAMEQCWMCKGTGVTA